MDEQEDKWAKFRGRGSVEEYKKAEEAYKRGPDNAAWNAVKSSNAYKWLLKKTDEKKEDE